MHIQEGESQFLKARVRRGFGGCHLSRILEEALSSPSWERAKQKQRGPPLGSEVVASETP